MVQISKALVHEMFGHALEEARREVPWEACGLVAFVDGRPVHTFRMTNVEKSPYRFSMDGREWLKVEAAADERGWSILGAYHSHVKHPAYPSQTDVRFATLLGPPFLHLVISLADPAQPLVRAFHIEDDEITEQALEVVEEH
jgi:[CysO sulfur-carrier protein]-S-L-cysteine hydrolase